ncbi:hypothetical protein SESBI_14281 [Sesbania bispinosa]|nr:hypothetical protein SESBI_14281 [Sesbania bispinosa]
MKNTLLLPPAFFDLPLFKLPRFRPASFCPSGTILAVFGVVPGVSGELFVHAFSCSSSVVHSPPRASSPRLERF